MQSGISIVKRALWVVFLCLAIISFPVPSLAVTVKEVPNPRHIYGGWVTDMANVFNSETEDRLNQMISRLEAKNGSEIAVVTVPDTKPSATPKKFATELFKYWGIGKKGKDNGVLFLISKRDRRVEIQTGYRIEKILPNARASSIINQQIIPRFKQGNFSDGTLAGTQALISALGENNRPFFSSKALHIHGIGLISVFFGLFPGLAAIIWGILIALRPPFVQPEGRSWVYGSGKNGAVNCANCLKPMEKLDAKSLLSYLSQPDQVAQTIGSVSFEGWRCLNCQPHLIGQGIHIRGYVLDSSRFSVCPSCQEWTIERTSQLRQQATPDKKGERLVTKKCHCCSYFDEHVEAVPWITPDYGYSSDGGSAGSFGGGDCGGGGAGGGW